MPKYWPSSITKTEPMFWLAMIFNASSTVVWDVTLVILLPLRSSMSATFLFIQRVLVIQSSRVIYNKWEGKTSQNVGSLEALVHYEKLFRNFQETAPNTNAPTRMSINNFHGYVPF